MLARDFAQVFGIPNVQQRDDVASINKSQYDAMTFRVQRRVAGATLQAHYTLAGAYAYGGSTGNAPGGCAGPVGSARTRRMGPGR